MVLKFRAATAVTAMIYLNSCASTPPETVVYRSVTYNSSDFSAVMRFDARGDVHDHVQAIVDQAHYIRSGCREQTLEACLDQNSPPEGDFVVRVNDGDGWHVYKP